MGYHSKKIQKGTLGEHTKIREEFEEFEDAFNQGNPVMELVELSDLLGAIEAYTEKQYGIGLLHLLTMTRATQSAFADGERGNAAVEVMEVKWRCRRCKSMVDMVAFRCKCKTSPSPWEQV